MLKMNSIRPREKWVPIDLGAHGNFELLVRRPTYQQQTEHLIADNRGAYSIDTACVDWRGLEGPEGTAIPFNLPNLRQVCEDFPTAFWLILGAATDAFRGFPETDAKN